MIKRIILLFAVVFLFNLNSVLAITQCTKFEDCCTYDTAGWWVYCSPTGKCTRSDMKSNYFTYYCPLPKTCSFNSVSNVPDCPSADATSCVALGDLNDKGQLTVSHFIAQCRDTNGDGCLELDDNVNNMIRCPSSCDQIGDFKYSCHVSGCPDGSCTIGNERCYTGDGVIDNRGFTAQVQFCADDNQDGCGEWLPYNVRNCPYKCDIYKGRCVLETETCDSQEETCNYGSYKCVNFGSEGELIKCGQYDTDVCSEWADASFCNGKPADQCTLPSGTFDFCDYGCSAWSLKCNPQTTEPCTSECALGETKCIGNTIFACMSIVKDGKTCYVYNDKTGTIPNNNVTRCPDTCEQTANGYAKCTLRPFGIEDKEIYNSNCTDVRGIAKYHDNLYVLCGDIDLDYPNHILVYNNPSFGNLGYTAFDLAPLTFIDLEGIGVDENYIYLLENGASYGNAVIHRLFRNYTLDDTFGGYYYSSMYTSLAVGDNYIYLYDTVQHAVIQTAKNDLSFPIRKIDIDPLLVKYDNFMPPPIWRIDLSLGLAVDEDAGYFYLSHIVRDSNKNNTYMTCIDRLQMSDGKFSNPIIKICEQQTVLNYNSWDDLTLDVDKGLLYAVHNPGCNGGGGCIGGQIKVWNYGGDETTIRGCEIGTRICAGQLYVNGSWIFPYIKTCLDENNNGYGTWSDAATDTCPYGCYENTETRNLECRNSLGVANCTDAEKECSILGQRTCQNGWLFICNDPDNNNCYRYQKSVKCAFGCQISNGVSVCSQCADECTPNETLCFPNGITDITAYAIHEGLNDFQFPQNINVPLIMNCSYDYNYKCYLWDITKLERCNLGCYNDVNDNNETMGICINSTDLISDYGNITDFTASFNSIKNDFISYFNIAFINDAGRYGVFLGISGVIFGIAMFTSRSWKMSLLIFISMVLLGSIIGWLPAWIMFILAAISGFYLLNKFYFNGGD